MKSTLKVLFIAIVLLINLAPKANAFQQSYDLKNSLPRGYVTDGSIDYTIYLQRAINSYESVSFPGFPIMVNDKGLVIPSNKTLIFQPGAKLILKPTQKRYYNILKIFNSQNIRIINAVIEGDRNGHLGNDGQWGAGIGIFSSQNIIIENAKISNCWGDGINIGQDQKLQIVPKNIEIRGATLTNNRRNGISVGCVEGLKILSSYIAYSNGQTPESGIDLEPNNASEVIKDVLISNVTTEGNKGAGILMYFPKLYGETGGNNINIALDNHIDKASTIGVRIIGYKLNPSNGGRLSGDITISNPRWINNIKRGFDANLLKESSLKLKLNGVSITDKGRQIKNLTEVKDVIKKASATTSNISIN